MISVSGIAEMEDIAGGCCFCIMGIIVIPSQVHSVLQKKFFEHLIYARHCARCWEKTDVNKIDTAPAFWSLTILIGDVPGTS